MGDKIKLVKVRRMVEIPTKEKVTMDDNDIDILNNLISLSSKKSKPSYHYEDDDDDDDFFSKKSKKKKKDKDKKKKKKKEKKKEKIKKPRLDLTKLKIFDDDEDVAKDSIDFYEQRFSSSLVLLTDSLKDIDNIIVENKKYLNELKSGQIGEHRIKMSPMTITSQMGNIASLINTRLSAIKQITDVNKSISDLEIKKFNTDTKINGGKKEGEAGNSNLLMDKVFDKLINHNNQIKKAEKEMFDDYELDDDEKTKKNKKKKEKEKIKEDDDDDDKKSKKEKKKEKKEYDSIDDRINDLLEAGELEFTDNESAFKYEKDGVEIAIQKKLKTGEWEFIALNSDGEELYDYPIPEKSNVGKVKFDEKSDTAKDALGQRYNVYFIK